jgi:hypothetical protein
MDLAHITLLAFAGFSLLRVVSYVPQIAKVAADPNGATAISYATWSMWTATHLATALYAAVNLQDLYFSVVSGIYAACCLVVISLTAIKRRAARPCKVVAQRVSECGEVKDAEAPATA